MRLKEFDYDLPKNLIAQKQLKPRDRSRLLVMDKKSGRLEHSHFFDLPSYLNKGDLLVLNDSKVFPARLIGKKMETGGKIEIFLLKKKSGRIWECLVGGKVRREGTVVKLGKKLSAIIRKRNDDGTWDVVFNMAGKIFMDEVDKVGEMPLPPYIKSGGKSKQTKADYQTIFANEKKAGSVAAPTAGLHFTPRLMKELKKKGVDVEYVTLHVGLGTFAPVKTERIEEHKMHSEWAEVSLTTMKKILDAKKEGRRIIAVGTTSVRTLESMAGKIGKDKKPRKLSFWTDIFIFPGYGFRLVDAMITNFHLPKSTLLMLVSAFAGRKNIRKAYSEAVKKNYRFFSFGDAMFLK